MNNKKHKTVLLKESIKALKIKQSGIYIDGTFGDGGHSLNILKKLGKNGKLYAIDKDPFAIKIAQRIQDVRFNIIHGNFSNIDILFKKNNLFHKIDGIILDLGISNMQIMSKHRGFSFNVNGPLDMRMNPNEGISASEWINKTSKKEIENILKYFGEEKFAKKISSSIYKKKNIQPIKTTKELSTIIQNTISKKNKSRNISTKSFQAIRIFINQELFAIKLFLQKIFNLLNNQGRIVIISFHSLEDRMIKNFMNKYSKKPIIPLGIPISEKKINQLYQNKLKVFKKIKPNKTEVKNNPKSRSAILRYAEYKN